MKQAKPQSSRQTSGKTEPGNKQASTKRHGTSHATKRRQASDPKPSHEGRCKQKTAGDRANPPTTGRQATQNQPRSRYRHQTAQNEQTHRLQAGKRQEPATKQVRAPKGTKPADPPTTGKQAPRPATKQAQARSGAKPGKPTKCRQLSGKERATRQVEARNGAKRARPQKHRQASGKKQASKQN